jgi:hypothetical protein
MATIPLHSETPALPRYQMFLHAFNSSQLLIRCSGVGCFTTIPTACLSYTYRVQAVQPSLNLDKGVVPLCRGKEEMN